MNPIQMKVEIRALKTLKCGQLLIEWDKERELGEVCKKINEHVGKSLKVTCQQSKTTE